MIILKIYTSASINTFQSHFLTNSVIYLKNINPELHNNSLLPEIQEIFT